MLLRQIRLTPKVYRKEKLSQIRQEVSEESEEATEQSA